MCGFANYLGIHDRVASRFFSCSLDVEVWYPFFVSVSSATLALLTFLLIIGCATQEQQSIARTKSASEDNDIGGWDEFRTWNRMGADHINTASGERRDWVAFAARLGRQPPTKKTDQR